MATQLLHVWEGVLQEEGDREGTCEQKTCPKGSALYICQLHGAGCTLYRMICTQST